jgi:hypothetical protein
MTGRRGRKVSTDGFGTFTRRFRLLMDTMYPDDHGPAWSELDIAPTTIHNLYHGKTKEPRLESLRVLEKRTGISMLWFAGDGEDDLMEKSMPESKRTVVLKIKHRWMPDSGEREVRVTLPLGLALRLHAQVAGWNSCVYVPGPTPLDSGVEGTDVLEPLKLAGAALMGLDVGNPDLVRLVLDQREALRRVAWNRDRTIGWTVEDGRWVESHDPADRGIIKSGTKGKPKTK